MRLFLIAFIVISVFFQSVAISGEQYRYDFMFPIMNQTWYFFQPHGVAADNIGYVYVADSWNHQIQKFTSDGIFVTKWGRRGSDFGNFNWPYGIAVDSLGCIYVTDMQNNRIQKFDSECNFLDAWGVNGSDNIRFQQPRGIAIDGNAVYVTDNTGIQKFTSDGKLIAKLGIDQVSILDGIAVSSNGFVYAADTKNRIIRKFSPNGQLIGGWKLQNFSQVPVLSGVAIDHDDFVYITDMSNHRIQKYSSEGEFIAEWGIKGNKDGEFRGPSGLSVDKHGYLYVTDTQNHRVQKFTIYGQFTGRWGFGGENGEFNYPKGLAMDSRNRWIYAADSDNHRIQKFSLDGTFLHAWGTEGSGDGEFRSPEGITTDSNDNIYIADTKNHRIQKFDANGIFVDKWGTRGGKEGELLLPSGIAVDSKDCIYISDRGNHRIQKFSSDGKFLTQWGNYGRGDGKFDTPNGISVNRQDQVYVADSVNFRIQQFDSEGLFLHKWEIDDHRPHGIAIDIQDHVYVTGHRENETEDLSDRIQIFTSDGILIDKWGTRGTDPGQLKFPCALAITPDGAVYVADSDNHRIQIFKKAPVKNQKAIIVAGGGPYLKSVTPGEPNLKNRLWDATRMCANFAYRTLTYRGFSKDRIQYFTTDLELDLDNNGKFDDSGKSDDIQGVPSAENLRNAITGWAKDADTVILYLVDHGEDNYFRLSNNERLSATEVNNMLNILPSTCEVIVIYDACHSGSFMEELTGSSDARRTVITSTEPGQNAHFITQGSISFSNLFWTQIFNGISIGESIEFVQQKITNQSPMFFSNKKLNTVYIGDSTYAYDRSDPIKDVTFDTDSLLISVSLDNANKSIVRVWAVIIPSDFQADIPNAPVLEYPSVELLPKENGNYEGNIPNMIEDAYQITVYARDKNGYTSKPYLYSSTLTFGNRQKAIIVAGEEPDGYWDQVKKNIQAAEEALGFQRIPEILKPKTLSELRQEIERLSLEPSTDIIIYLTGKGEPGAFRINPAEKLLGSDLNAWLSKLQNTTTGKVIVIADFDYADTFMSSLIQDEDASRILISGVSAKSGDSGTSLYFIRMFWNSIRYGDSILTAFYTAKNISGAEDLAEGAPRLTDFGNFADDFVIGSGVKIAGPFHGIIKGSVKNAVSKLPVPEAQVSISEKPLCRTRSDGRYFIIYEAGKFDVKVEKNLYLPSTLYKIPIDEGGITDDVDFELIPVVSDSDGDGYPDDADAFPSDPSEWADTDRDGKGDNADQCPKDPKKTEKGVCGCGVPDTDSDRDGVPDCKDACPDDPNKTEKGVCGCGTPDIDRDGDQSYDCQDECPENPDMTKAGPSGCNSPDTPDTPVVPPKPSDGPTVRPELFMPVNGGADLPLTPTLQARRAETPDEKLHVQTRWQISASPDFSQTVLDKVVSEPLLTLSVPESALTSGSNYFWRVKFIYSDAEASEWSEAFSFTTVSTDASEKNQGKDSADIRPVQITPVSNDDIGSVSCFISTGMCSEWGD